MACISFALLLGLIATVIPALFDGFAKAKAFGGKKDGKNYHLRALPGLGNTLGKPEMIEKKVY